MGHDDIVKWKEDIRKGVMACPGPPSIFEDDSEMMRILFGVNVSNEWCSKNKEYINQLLADAVCADLERRYKEM